MEMMDFNKISLNEKKMESKDVKSIFCQYWDTTELLLETLKTVIKNPIVKVIIGAIIALGSNVHDKVCKPE